MAGYAEAKAAVFRNQKDGDVLVLNADDPPTAALTERAACKVVWFSRKSVVEDGVYLKDGVVDVPCPAAMRQIIIPADEVRIRAYTTLRTRWLRRRYRFRPE